MKKLSELDLYVGPIVGESKETRATYISIKWKIKEWARECIKELEVSLANAWEDEKDFIEGQITFIKRNILEEEQ